jgi:hypothetical protein
VNVGVLTGTVVLPGVTVKDREVFVAPWQKGSKVPVTAITSSPGRHCSIWQQDTEQPRGKIQE